MENPDRPATDLSAAVAKEVRVLLVRRDMKQSEMAARMGVTEMWLSRRLRGAQEIGVNDLAKMASVLSVEVGELLPRSNEGHSVISVGGPRAKTTGAYPHPTKQPTPPRGATRTHPNPSSRRTVRQR